MSLWPPRFDYWFVLLVLLAPFLLAFLLTQFHSFSLLLFSLFFPRLLCLFLLQDSRWKRETYAREAEMSFLSSLVSSPSATQGAAKDLWSAGLSPTCVP